MDTDTVTLFFALLATAAQAAVAVAVATAIAALASPRIRTTAAGLRADVAPSATALAAGVAAVCTAGSLYLSEVANFPPCRLCWYQRGAMYPIVAVAGLGAWASGRSGVSARRTAAGARIAAAVLAALGAGVSTYHLLVERYPSIEARSSCDLDNPCSIRWVEHFGYLTIPGMALSGFALILTLLALAGRTPEESP